jgi:microcystin-dependent protein
MTAMPPLRDILNNTPANAVDVDYNFNAIEAHIGAELINRDGSVAMTGPLTLPGPPTAPQQAATKAYVDSNVVPIGVMWEYAGTAAPAGWALCDGRSVSTTDPAYAALFAVIGYRHGGAGANFNLPDMRGRMPIGYGAAHTPTLGGVGGRTDTVVASHQHTGNTGIQSNDHAHNANHYHTASSGTESADHTHSGTTDNQGTHNHWSMSNGEQLWYYGGGGTLGMDTSGTGHSGAPSNLTTPGVRTSTDGGHQHSMTTGGRSAAHTHGITVDWNNFNTAGVTANHTHAITTDPAGVAAANQNLPPFVAINFIIRIG